MSKYHSESVGKIQIESSFDYFCFIIYFKLSKKSILSSWEIESHEIFSNEGILYCKILNVKKKNWTGIF